MQIKQDSCETVTGLLKKLKDKFKPQHDTKMPLFQYCKISQQNDEKAEGLMGSLRIKGAEGEYKENDRRLKEQFINGRNATYIRYYHMDTVRPLILGLPISQVLTVWS